MTSRFCTGMLQPSKATTPTKRVREKPRPLVTGDEVQRGATRAHVECTSGSTLPSDDLYEDAQ